jgi:protein-S-isoprenylcysteine O-methyltransferase Ste14
MLATVMALGLGTDRLLSLPALLPGPAGAGPGIALLVLGGALSGWCVFRFKKAHGTPVPFNPPTELVVEGPYLWTRNPMVTGIVAVLFGVGLILHSLSMVLVWTPLFLLVHVIELKKVEEPELELRFGGAYAEYKRRVPRLIPRPWRRR